MTIRVLKDKGQPNTKIAEMLGVTEGTVRYHLRRVEAVDGRKKRFLIEQWGLVEVCKSWWDHQIEVLPECRSPNAQSLWQMMLVDHHGYTGSVTTQST